MPSPSVVRAFIALELTAPLHHWLAELIANLSEAVPPRTVRWARATGIHLTLKFLGDTPSPQLPQVQTTLAAAAQEFAPLTLTTAGLGCFPDFHRPRVVWLGVQTSEASTLGHLQAAIETRLAPLGLAPEERGFSPHLTLGRVNRETHPAEAKYVGQLVRDIQLPGAAPSQPVGEVSLMQSRLKPGGAVYTRLFAAPLGKT